MGFGTVLFPFDDVLLGFVFSFSSTFSKEPLFELMGLVDPISFGQLELEVVQNIQSDLVAKLEPGFEGAIELCL